MKGRWSLAVVLVVMASFIASLANGAAVTSQEWQWIVAAQEKEQAGDIPGAMEYWTKLVDSLKTHNYDACGNYAQKLGRALDKQGRYAEAVTAFEAEFECWSRFPDRGEWTLWDERRVEQIRPEVRAFVARPTSGEFPGRLAKHEPAYGTMLGGTIDLDPAVLSDPARVAAAYGKNYAMILAYVHWGDVLPVVVTRNAKAAGAALQVAMEPNEGLDVVQDGPYLRSFAASLKEYGLPVFLRWAGEMNGAWTAWHGDPAKYREKFALVARVMREEAPNVAMVWSPNFVGDAPMEEYYPGDDLVDWVGVNLYHDPYFLGDPNQSQMFQDIYYQGKRTNPLDKLKGIYAQYARRKPIMVSETGFGWANRSDDSDHTGWASSAVRRFYGYLPLLYPRVKAVAYFNVDLAANGQIEGKSHYLLSARPAMAAAFKAATAPGWYLADPSGTAPELWRPMEMATLLGPTRVSAYVNLADGVSKVEYLLNGQVAATASSVPWVAELDLSGLTGENTVTVRAYDSKGSAGAERTYRFDASAIRVDLNGRYIDFDQPPVNVDGRVLVPARAILEALGAEISWEAATRTVIAKKDGSTLRLQIDNPVPTRDGIPLLALSVPAQIINNRTLVPARFVAENFNMDVKWDQATRTVLIRPLP